jgi:site-specific recombinase XerD
MTAANVSHNGASACLCALSSCFARHWATQLSQGVPAQSVADIVKSYAERVGLDPAQFAGHSMRSGFLTSAAKRGASIFKMMDQSRHRSVETLRGYVRDAEIFKEHAGAGLL